jgi:hypothetical protein
MSEFKLPTADRERLFVEYWDKSVVLMNTLINKDLTKDVHVVKTLHALVYAVLALGMKD